MLLECAKFFQEKSNQISIIDHAKRKLNFNEIEEKTIENNEIEEKNNSENIENTTNMQCQLVIRDVKKHPWWGPKVRQLSGEKDTVIKPKILKRQQEQQPEQQSKIEDSMDVFDKLLSNSIQSQKVSDKINVAELEQNETIETQEKNQEKPKEDHIDVFDKLLSKSQKVTDKPLKQIQNVTEHQQQNVSPEKLQQTESQLEQLQTVVQHTVTQKQKQLQQTETQLQQLQTVMQHTVKAKKQQQQSVTQQKQQQIVAQMQPNTTQSQQQKIVAQQPFDLKKLETQVETEAFSSMLEFHLEFKNILKLCPMPKSIKRKWIKEFMDQYKIVSANVFPWFDANRPLQHFEAIDNFVVKQPIFDHKYTKTILEESKPIDVFDKLLFKSRPRRSRNSNIIDLRSCLFCGLNGDRGRQEAGRLLHYRQNQWIHANCALWSSEVYEEEDASLQNVAQALSRGSKLICTVCSKKGATIGK